LVIRTIICMRHMRCWYVFSRNWCHLLVCMYQLSAWLVVWRLNGWMYAVFTWYMVHYCRGCIVERM
jgi:hypothetical protein